MPRKGSYNVFQREMSISAISNPDSTENVTEVDSPSDAQTEDSLTSIINEFGLYQGLWMFLLGLTGINTGILIYSNKFFTTEVDYWCAKPQNLSLSKDQWINISAPIIMDGDTPKFDRCHIFNVSYSDTSQRPPNDTATMKCDKWEYDNTNYKVIWLTG